MFIYWLGLRFYDSFMEFGNIGMCSVIENIQIMFAIINKGFKFCTMGIVMRFDNVMMKPSSCKTPSDDLITFDSQRMYVRFHNPSND